MRGEITQVTAPIRDAGIPAAPLEPVVLPVLPPLRCLFPDGGLRGGSVVSADRWGLLCMVLAAAASAAGAWCAIVGLPEAGVLAATDAGLDPARLLLAADPGPRWPQAVAALLEGCELVLAAVPPGVPAALRRRIEATARRHGGVLIAAGGWEGAPLRLSVARQQWTGMGSGHGRLQARRALVMATGRGAAGQPRSQWLWLPGPDGQATAAGPPETATTHAPWRRQAAAG
jgi:hypothetical protein